MKTSPQIEDSLFRAAQKEAQKTGKPLSETISGWARVGRRVLRAEHERRAEVAPVDLGGPAAIGVNCRRDWMNELEWWSPSMPTSSVENLGIVDQ